VCEVKPRPENPTEFAQIRRCVRTLLTKGTNETLPITYEAIYLACRSIVCLSNKGEGLYQTVRMEIEQSLAHLAKELLDEKRTRGQWIDKFVQACDWFEKQVVSTVLPHSCADKLLIGLAQVLLQSWLTYLDRVYVLQDTKLRNLQYVCFMLLCKLLMMQLQ